MKPKLKSQWSLKLWTQIPGNGVEIGILCKIWRIFQSLLDKRCANRQVLKQLTCYASEISADMLKQVHMVHYKA